MMESAWKIPIAHPTLTLAQIDPVKSRSFSPNLHKWMQRRAHFLKNGGVMEGVFRVKPGTAAARTFGEGVLLIGQAYDRHEGDMAFTGVRLIAALCQGVAAGSSCYLGLMRDLEEIPGFWDAYLKVGRCAIDPDHREHFLGNRFSMEGDTRTCLWCGAKHERVMVARTVFDETWKAVPE